MFAILASLFTTVTTGNFPGSLSNYLLEEDSPAVGLAVALHNYLFG